MSDKYYIKIQVAEANNASSKAVNDCNSILDNNGVLPYVLKIKKGGNRYIKKINNYIQIKKIGGIKKNSVVFIPHPIYLNKRYMDILGDIKRKRNIKLVFIIHDLESVRKMFPDAAEDFEYMDNTMYNIADYIIAHNEKMKEYLISKNVDEKKIVDLQIFDYLTDSNPDNKQIKYSKTLNIAGNLNVDKCKYIKKLNDIDKSIQFNLYGSNFDEKAINSPSIHYKGTFPASDLPNQLTEGFGLVWDGDGINGCTGVTGEYLRYNNPHKLSLYLVSGLPVVVWKESAEAEFVKANNVGILVDSVEQFSSEFDNLDEKDYYKMLENVRNISVKLRKGEYLQAAIKEILKNS